MDFFDFQLDSAYGQVPDNFCGQCGTEVPKGKTHCSPECAARWEEMLAKAKGCPLCEGRGLVDDPNNCGGCETCARVFGTGPSLITCPRCQPDPKPSEVGSDEEWKVPF